MKSESSFQPTTAPRLAQRPKFKPDPSLKLRQQVHQVMRFFHYAERSEESYWHWIERFLKFHRRASGAQSPDTRDPVVGAREGSRPGKDGWRHPRGMGAAEGMEFLARLASGRQGSASTPKQALNGPEFPYAEVLDQPLGDLGDLGRIQRPKRLPVFLTQEELKALLAQVDAQYSLPVRLQYGAGLRLLELLRLRVKDLDVPRRQLTVRSGKGFKGRVTMVPETLAGELSAHLNRVRQVHEQDRRDGLAGVWLPPALGRKYPNAGKEWPWFWVFPARKPSEVWEEGVTVRRRHHLVEDSVQRAIK